MVKRVIQLALVSLLAAGTAPAAAATATVAWDRNPEPDIAGYIVHWGVQSRVYTFRQQVGNVTSFTVPALDPGQTYYFAVQAVNADSLASPLSEETSWTVPTGFSFDGTRAVLGDFIGDGRAHPSVFRRSAGEWYMMGRGGVRYGTSTDVPAPADYDGDGRLDLAVWRPSTATWWIVPSSTSLTTRVQWGNRNSNDVPLPGDYDGDGLADIAVWRPETAVWWILRSSDDYAYSTRLSIQWGQAGGADLPVPADYDGDGATDIAVWRPSTGTWWILPSSASFRTSARWMIQWGDGRAGDVPVPADYDGDGCADLAVWRPAGGYWWVLQSSDDYAYHTRILQQWGDGRSNDVPVPADYDGDGIADLAFWRPATAAWSIRTSSRGTTSTIQYGNAAAGDLPLLAGWPALKRYLQR